MNPAFECPTFTPAEEMAKYIEESDVPSFVTDCMFRVIAKNKHAETVLDIKDKELILRLVYPQDYIRFTEMKVGQITRIKFNCENKSFVTVSRFRDYYLFRLEKDMTGFVQTALKIKAESEKSLSEVEEFYARMGNELLKTDRSLAELRERQLSRRLNAHQMLEMVSDSGLRLREVFEPAVNASKVCNIANEYLDPLGVYVSCRVNSTPYGCSGVVSEYQTAIAAMLAVAAENSGNGIIRVKNVYSEHKYILDVNFELAARNSFGTEKTDEQLEFIRCIAESNGWYARFSQTERYYDLFLILPCSETRLLEVREPAVDTWLRYTVRMQFADLHVPGRRRSKR